MKRQYEIVIEQTIRRTIIAQAASAEEMRNIINDYGVIEAFNDWDEDQSKAVNDCRIVTIVRAKS